MAAKQGFLMYYSKGDAIGTRVSVRYRRSGRLSEVVVKRGSTVILYSNTQQKYYVCMSALCVELYQKYHKSAIATHIINTHPDRVVERSTQPVRDMV